MTFSCGSIGAEVVPKPPVWSLTSQGKRVLREVWEADEERGRATRLFSFSPKALEA